MERPSLLFSTCSLRAHTIWGFAFKAPKESIKWRPARRLRELKRKYMSSITTLSTSRDAARRTSGSLLEQYREQYEHPLWRKLGSQASDGGHGGADYIMLYRFVDSLIKRTAPEQDVYDAATWSVITPVDRKIGRRPWCSGGISGFYPRQVEIQDTGADHWRVAGMRSEVDPLEL